MFSTPAAQQAKAIIAGIVGLIGAVTTALLGVVAPDTELFAGLTVTAAVVTAIGTYLGAFWAANAPKDQNGAA